MTAILTVSNWHNVTRDAGGRHAGFGGFTPGDQMVKVFTYDTPATGRSAPSSDEDAALARQYRQRRLRSLSVGDMVVVGETALTVASAGFTPLRGTFTPVCVHEHGTHPIA
jgi:hypothetical protein